jgi:hypothetical protein
MKKVIITIAILIASMSLANAQDRTPNFTQDGKTFVQGARKGSSRASKDQPTAYTWRDSKGNEYPIFLHTYERGEKAGRTTCYVVKTSAKTGKEYKYYLPDGEAIASKILEGSKNAKSI